MPTPDLSWGHININVSDLDTSIAFYEKLPNIRQHLSPVAKSI